MASRLKADIGVGIDLGSGSMKIAVIEERGEGLVLSHAGYCQLSSDCVRNGVVEESRAVRDAIRSVLPPSMPSHARCVVSIPTDQAQTKWISMPEMPADDYQAAVQLRSKKLFDLDGGPWTVCGAEPMPTSSDESVDALVIAVESAIVESRAETIASAGLLPTGAELEAQALLRLLDRTLERKNSPTREGSWTVVDLGLKRTQMLVVQNQRLQFHRGVRFGGNRFEAKLVENLALSNDEAVAQLYHEMSHLTPEGMFITAERRHVDMSQPLEALIREFTRLLRYFRSLHPERSYGGVLDNVLLCGGLSALSGLGEALQARLGLKVETLRPFSGLKIDLTTAQYLSVMRRQACFAVATGLALSGLQTPKQQGRSDDEFVWRRAS